MEFKGTKYPWNLQNELTVWGAETQDRVCVVDESINIQTGLRGDVCRANAKLIASAPDLLETLLRVKKILKDEWPLEEWQDFDEKIGYSKAINKALN